MCIIFSDECKIVHFLCELFKECMDQSISSLLVLLVCLLFVLTHVKGTVLLQQYFSYVIE